jgi:hypothetical protein
MPSSYGRANPACIGKSTITSCNKSHRESDSHQRVRSLLPDQWPAGDRAARAAARRRAERCKKGGAASHIKTSRAGTLLGAMVMSFLSSCEHFFARDTFSALGLSDLKSDSCRTTRTVPTL